MEEQNENLRSTKSASGTASIELHSRITQSLLQVAVCVRSLGLYGKHHPLIREMAAQAHQTLVTLLIIQPTVVIGVGAGYLSLESFPIQDPSGGLAAFAVMLNEHQVSEFKLLTGVTEAEIMELSDVLSLSHEDLLMHGGIIIELERRGVHHIQMRQGAVPLQSREGKDPVDIYEEALLLVEESLRAIQSGLQIPVMEIRGVVADSLHSLIADESALLALTGIRTYNRYLSEHSVNVCIISMVLGRDFGLDASTTLELGISAMLHDVGKVFIDSAVLNKPSKLSEEEWEQMRKHPVDGARVLAGLEDLPALTSTIALEHHIYLDGTGYPSLPIHQQPQLLSRLVAIVDTYDALTTDRPYKERWTTQRAIAYMMYDAADRYDKQLIARFASRSKLHPIGSIVRLIDGRIAVVTGGSQLNPTRPILRVIDDTVTDSNEGEIIDLTQTTDPSLEIDVMAQPVEALLPYIDMLTAPQQDDDALPRPTSR